MGILPKGKSFPGWNNIPIPHPNAKRICSWLEAKVNANVVTFTPQIPNFSPSHSVVDFFGTVESTETIKLTFEI